MLSKITMKKIVVGDHPDGVFAQFSRFYGNDCGITVCGQYDDDNRFHVEYYYYPFSEELELQLRNR